MKYKIKFEIKYGQLSKDEIRDHKLDLLNQDVTTEIVSDYPLNIPSKDEYIELGEELYSINDIYHKIGKDCYTSVISITSNKVKNIIERENQKHLMEKMRQMLK